MRTPLTAYLAADVPSPPVAAHALRLAYAVVFVGQVGVASVAAGLLAWALPAPPRPNDLVAGVLVAFAAAHLPLGAALAWSASGSPGKGAALAGAITAAVLLSVPGWFVALLVVSAQRPLFVLAGGALLAVGYGLGFALTPRFVRAATTPPPPPADDDAGHGAGTRPPGGMLSRVRRPRRPRSGASRA